MSPAKTVLLFFERINRRNPDRLVELMTEDHLFIDSLGRSVHGREAMRAAWHGYYATCPDYWVSHEEIFTRGKLVAVIGEAGGTIATKEGLLAANKWRSPAAWFARIHNGLVKEWRVYADNKPVYDILAKSSSASSP